VVFVASDNLASNWVNRLNTARSSLSISSSNSRWA
jgi:hypothetical protein